MKDLIQEGVNEGVTHKDDVPFMMLSKPTAGRLYSLVKDNAPQSKWLFDKIPPLRPVILMSGSNTEGLSHWVDEQAKAENHKLPSYVEDTRHLLQIFQETNETKRQPAHAIPVVMDITNMYGNIPWEDGNIAFQDAMDQREDLSVPTSFIMKVLSVVLSRNVFEFLGKLFIQLFGVAMGSRVAPTYACIFMGWLEKKMLLDWTGLKPILWKRYIDDIFFIWYGTKSELLDFVTFLNSYHPTIKFKCNEFEHFNFQTRSVDFLDLSISIDDSGSIQTTLYTKPNMKVQYLLPSSCHSSHITKNIPYSLAYRLRRIESNEANFEHNLNVLKNKLIGRQYKEAHVDAAFQKAKALTREETLKKTPRNSKKELVLSLKYHPGLPNISPIVRKHWKVLTHDPDFKRIFQILLWFPTNELQI